jgi:hypothetical protein
LARWGSHLARSLSLPLTIIVYARRVTLPTETLRAEGRSWSQQEV